VAKLTIHSDPISYTEASDCVAVGLEATKLLTENTDRDLLREIRRYVDKYTRRIRSKHSSLADPNTNINVIITQPVLAPFLTPQGNLTQNVLGCYLVLNYTAEVVQDREYPLVIGLVMDPKTRRFIDATKSPRMSEIINGTNSTKQ
jgi:hypothetical protein